MSLLEQFVGPLGAEECRRALRPAWLRWTCVAAAVPAAGVVIVTTWLIQTFRQFDAAFMPGPMLTDGLLVMAIWQAVLALLMSPALVAGTIAGEKDRGTLALLLVSRQTAGEIVWARFVGRIVQVGALATASVPCCVLLAALCNFGGLPLVLLAALPTIVALGSAGVALAASTLARRGRDALLAVYFITVLVLLLPLLPPDKPWIGWLRGASPLNALWALVGYREVGPSIACTGVWMALGLIGWSVAAWQLRPAYLRQLGGSGRRAGVRRHMVPDVPERPMLWKELFIERTNTLGGFGRWASILLIFALFLASAVIGVSLLSSRSQLFPSGEPLFGDMASRMAELIAASSTPLLWFLQWAVGLRAAGVVSIERQRHTWDALLTSPLEGREIIWAKTWGSLYALRWMLLATIVAWVSSTFAGTIEAVDAVILLALLFSGGALMAAAGVAISLRITNPTRGMALTIGTWMISALGTAALAGLIALASSILLMMVYLTYQLTTLGPEQTAAVGLPNFGDILGVAYVVLRVGIYLLITFLIAGAVAVRFDRLAGRQSAPLNISV